MAIRKVTQINRGKHTAGVANQGIDDHKGREHIYELLSQTTSKKFYPAKRVYIAKKNGGTAISGSLPFSTAVDKL